MKTPRSDKAWKAFKHSSNAQHIRSESCRLETELAEVAKERDAIKLRNDTLETENAVRRADSYADQKAAREAMDERDALIRGEYVCKKCGIRKDGEGAKGDF